MRLLYLWIYFSYRAGYALFSYVSPLIPPSRRSPIPLTHTLGKNFGNDYSIGSYFPMVIFAIMLSFACLLRPF